MNSRTKLFSFLGIIGGFAIGQGSGLALNIYLGAKGDLSSVAAIGVSLGVLTLLQWAVDWGGTSIFAREIISPSHDYPQSFLGILGFRLLLSIVVGISLLIIVFTFPGKFGADKVLIYGLPSLLLWSLNLTGIADSFGRSGFIGPLNSLNWLMASVAGFMVHGSVGFYSAVGFFFSLGTFVTVALHWLLLYSYLKSHLGIKKNLLIDARPYIYEGAVFNFSFISGQFYGRLVPIILLNQLGSSTTGAYVLVRNLFLAICQFIVAARRVEYSSVILFIKEKNPGGMHILLKQKISYISCIFFYFSALIISFLSFQFGGQKWHETSLVSIAMIQVLPFWLMSSALGQAMLAAKLTKIYTATQTLTLISAALFLVAISSRINLFIVITIEIIMFGAQALFYWRCFPIKGR